MTWSSPTWWGVLLAASVVAAGRAPLPARTVQADDPAAGRPRREVGHALRRRAPRPSSPVDRASALALWCDAVARALRSGASLADALDEAPEPDTRAVPADDPGHDRGARARRSPRHSRCLVRLRGRVNSHSSSR